MNDWLAQVYGTKETIAKNAAAAQQSAQTEKTAGANDPTKGEQVLMAKIATDLAEENIDINSLSEEGADSLLDYYLTNLSPEDIAALEEIDAEDGGGNEQLTAEAQAKLAEATVIGQAVAHALYAELTEIGKAAEATAQGAQGVGIMQFVEKQAGGAGAAGGRLAALLAAAKAKAAGAWAHPGGKIGAGAAGGLAAGVGGMALLRALQKRKAARK